DHHRPEDQAEDAKDVELVDLELVVAGKGLAEGIDRRRADIAVDDADGADDELVDRTARMTMRGVLRSLTSGTPSGGNVHLVLVRPDRLRTRIPCAARQVVGHGRASLALRPERCNRWGQGRKPR